MTERDPSTVADLEAALAVSREAERRYRLLADGASEMLSLHALDGRIEFVSAASRTLFGYEPEWLTDRDPGDFAHPDDVPALRSCFLEMLEHLRPSSRELRIRRSSGDYLQVEVKMSPVTDEHGQPYAVKGTTRDISDRVEAEERFRLALEEAPIGMSVLDVRGHWLVVNRALVELTGWSREQLLATTFQEITHPDDLDHDLELAGELLAGRIKHYGIDKRYRRPDGSYIWVHLSVSVTRDANDEPRYYICHVQDISARRRAEEELAALALTDPLTGVANRRLLGDRLGQAQVRRNRAGGEIAVIFVDLDALKAINDRLGHGAGDSVLCEIAQRLVDAVREEDTVARVGGDEFVVVCSIVDAAHFEQLLERVQLVCEAPMAIGSEVLPLGASVGGVLAGLGEPLESVLGRADAAMYEQKAARRVSTGGGRGSERSR